MGSSPPDNFYRLCNELIDMEKIDFVDSGEYMRVEDRDGNSIRVFADVERLEAEILEKTPEDGNIIREFTGALKKLSNFNLPLGKHQELYSFMDGLKMMARVAPYMRVLKKWSGISAKEYAARCWSLLFAKTIESLFIPEMSAIMSGRNVTQPICAEGRKRFKVMERQG